MNSISRVKKYPIYTLQSTSKIVVASLDSNSPDCFQEFYDLIKCVNSETEYSKCNDKYITFIDCIKK